MADRYWIANLEANQLWTTATNWADNADGTGANTVPVANDNVHFGHATTLAAGKGFGSCELAGATATLAKFTSYEDYNQVQTTNNFTINVSGKFIPNPATGFSLEKIGFRVGMVITVSGAATAGNNSTFEISSLSSNEITVTSATGMATELTPVELTITYDPSLDLKGQQLNMTSPAGGTLMTLNSKIKNTTGTGGINLTGAFVGGSGNRYLLCGSNQTFENRDVIIMTITSVGGSLYFDDGIYPIVQLGGGSFSCDYLTPTSINHGAVKFYKFKETTACTWNSGLNSPRNNTKKIFEVDSTTSFALLTSNFDTGQSTWSFDTDDSFTIPTSGDFINYASGFTVRWYNLIIKNSSGNTAKKALVPARRNLQVNSLTIETGGQVIGELTQSGSGTAHKGSSTITSVNRPVIKGAWNFSQVADGVYASLLTESYSITPSHGNRGALQFSYGGGTFHSQSKMNLVLADWENDWTTANAYLLLSDGAYINSSFYEFCQTYDPASGAGNNRIWISNGSPSVPYFTDSAGTKHSLLGGGGGGMTSFDVAGTSGSAQTITNGNTLTIAAGTGITTTASATDTVTVASTITQYTDAMAIAAVEGEATLDLTGDVTMANKKLIVDTTTLVVNAPSYTDKVGIGTATPANPLHVKNATTLGDAAYAARFQTAEGNVGITRYGGIHVDNDNNAPIDGADWSSQRWQISQRDTDHLDIAYGTPTNTNVGAGDTDLRITNTGNVGIGLGNTNPSAKLHVSGTIRQTNATDKIIYADANGDLGALTIGTNLSMSGSTLNATGGGGGAATEVIEWVNSNTTIGMNTTIAVCASATTCTAKAGVVGSSWSGMTTFGTEFENYDFTATGAQGAHTGLINLPVPTVGRKLTLIIPFSADGATLAQGVTQITCTGQSKAFIGHDLAGFKNAAGKVVNGNQIILPERYLYSAWNTASRTLNCLPSIGHHAITLVGAPAPTGTDAAKIFLNVGGYNVTFADLLGTAYWWVETTNEFLWDSNDRNNPPTGFFSTSGFNATAWGQLYVVC